MPSAGTRDDALIAEIRALLEDFAVPFDKGDSIWFLYYNYHEVI